MTNSTSSNATSKPEVSKGGSGNSNGNGIAAAHEASKAAGGKTAPATTAQTGKPETKPGKQEPCKTAPAAAPAALPKAASKKGPKVGEQVNVLGQQQKELAERLAQNDNRLSGIESGLAELLRRSTAPAAAPHVPSNAELIRRQRAEDAALQQQIDEQNAADLAAEQAAYDAEHDLGNAWELLTPDQLRNIVAAATDDAELGAAMEELNRRRKIVSYAAAKPTAKVPGGSVSVDNPLPRQTVQRQLSDAERIASFRLRPGQQTHRDYTRHTTMIQKRDDNGQPLFGADQKPLMEKANASCNPPVRRYIETMCQGEYPQIDLHVFDSKGQPTGGRISCKFVTSQRSGNPMFKIADASFFLKDSNGNVFEFGAPSSRGLYLTLKGYNGAPIADAFGNVSTREDAA